MSPNQTNFELILLMISFSFTVSFNPNTNKVLLGVSKPGLAGLEGQRRTLGGRGGFRLKERIDFPVEEADQ